MKRIERVLTALLCLALLLTTPVSLAEGETKTATILFTHDMHSHFLPVNTEDGGQSGGYARLYTLLQQQRAEYAADGCNSRNSCRALSIWAIRGKCGKSWADFARCSAKTST